MAVEGFLRVLSQTLNPHDESQAGLVLIELNQFMKGRNWTFIKYR
jgi:hypothetical protein